MTARPVAACVRRRPRSAGPWPRRRRRAPSAGAEPKARPHALAPPREPVKGRCVTHGTHEGQGLPATYAIPVGRFGLRNDRICPTCGASDLVTDSALVTPEAENGSPRWV